MFRMNASDELVKWFNEFTNYKLTALPASAVIIMIFAFTVMLRK